MEKTCSVPECENVVRARGWCAMHYYRFKRHGTPTGGRAFVGAPMRWLHAHLDYDGEECLKWPFGERGAGYGTIKYDGRDRYAHEMILEFTVGKRPTPESDARHLCGKGHNGCVNPKHLAWGSKKENAHDNLLHGTHSRGERSGTARLTEIQIYEIRAKLASGVTHQAIADEYKISAGHVGQIKRGQSWGWLETPAE